MIYSGNVLNIYDYIDLFVWNNDKGVKAHYRGAKIVVTLYCFSRVPCLNFNCVISMNDFHSVFTYYGRSKPKEIK
jgi:hypothetical protein